MLVGRFKLSTRERRFTFPSGLCWPTAGPDSTDVTLFTSASPSTDDRGSDGGGVMGNVGIGAGSDASVGRRRSESESTRERGFAAAADRAGSEVLVCSEADSPLFAGRVARRLPAMACACACALRLGSLDMWTTPAGLLLLPKLSTRARMPCPFAAVGVFSSSILAFELSPVSLAVPDSSFECDASDGRVGREAARRLSASVSTARSAAAVRTIGSLDRCTTLVGRRRREMDVSRERERRRGEGESGSVGVGEDARPRSISMELGVSGTKGRELVVCGGVEVIVV